MQYSTQNALVCQCMSGFVSITATCSSALKEWYCGTHLDAISYHKVMLVLVATLQRVSVQCHGSTTLFSPYM